MSQKKNTEEPVYFMDLVVENVRCFKDRQVMDLSDGNGKPARWTIILGDNGTGKTTLLRSIAMLEPEEFDNGSENGIRVYPKALMFNDFHKLYNNTDDRKIFLGTTNLFVGNLLSKPVRLLEEFSFMSTGNIQGNTNVIKIRKEQLFLLAYGANRKSGVGSLTETKNEDLTLSLFMADISLINAEAWLLETNFAITNSKGSTKKYLENHYLKVKDTLKILLPDVQDFRIKEITKKNRQAAIEVKTPYGWVDMKNLSLGYQTFIAWVVDLAARLFDRYPDSENPLEEPCLVLVDEIDLHLHPKWQRKIVGFLSDIFKNAQFIVTAHSPLIVQAAAGANLVLLKREGDSVKIHNNVEKERIEDWTIDQILTSDLYDLITSRPPKFDDILERKQAILKKRTITRSDEKELENISKELENLPLKNKNTNEALEALKRAAAILKS